MRLKNEKKKRKQTKQVNNQIYEMHPNLFPYSIVVVNNREQAHVYLAYEFFVGLWPLVNCMLGMSIIVKFMMALLNMV